MTELEFGARLKQLRQNKRLTQQELADQLGVSNKSVSRWESGGYPDVTLLAPLAKALGVSTDELLGCQPPLRSFGRSDWQNLMSYAFALGGGVVFFLFDLFMPVVICYLLYLAMMAYGIYLQRHYTYHSHWFYGANALMDLFINLQLTAFVAGGSMLFSGIQSFSFPTSPYYDEAIEKLAFVCEYGLYLLMHLLPWFLAALILTGMTQLVVWYTAGKSGKLPKLTLRLSQLEFSKILPILSPILLAGFWLIYCGKSPLPPWWYINQELLFLVLWLVLTAATAVYLLVINHKRMLFPACLMQLGCLCYTTLAPQMRIFSKLTQRLLPNSAEYNASVYVRFGQFGWALVLASVLLAALYLLCSMVKLEATQK